jgi:hypothetical protein
MAVCRIVATLTSLNLCTIASAQDTELIDGTIVFVDEDSGLQCGAVNTINADFMIRSCDRRLILLSGDDRATPYTVDLNYDVFHDDGTPSGYVRFATDRDNFRQVFWLTDGAILDSDPNKVLRYDSANDTLTVATAETQDEEGNVSVIAIEPVNVQGTECNPSAQFDGNDELLCARACGSGGFMASALLMFGLAGLRVRTRRPNC